MKTTLWIFTTIRANIFNNYYNFTFYCEVILSSENSFQIIQCIHLDASFPFSEQSPLKGV